MTAGTLHPNRYVQQRVDEVDQAIEDAVFNVGSIDLYLTELAAYEAAGGVGQRPLPRVDSLRGSPVFIMGAISATVPRLVLMSELRTELGYSTERLLVLAPRLTRLRKMLGLGVNAARIVQLAREHGSALEGVGGVASVASDVLTALLPSLEGATSVEALAVPSRLLRVLRTAGVPSEALATAEAALAFAAAAVAASARAAVQQAVAALEGEPTPRAAKTLRSALAEARTAGVPSEALATAEAALASAAEAVAASARAAVQQAVAALEGERYATESLLAFRHACDSAAAAGLPSGDLLVAVNQVVVQTAAHTIQDDFSIESILAFRHAFGAANAVNLPSADVLTLVRYVLGQACTLTISNGFSFDSVLAFGRVAAAADAAGLPTAQRLGAARAVFTGAAARAKDEAFSVDSVHAFCCARDTASCADLPSEEVLLATRAIFVGTAARAKLLCSPDSIRAFALCCGAAARLFSFEVLSAANDIFVGAAARVVADGYSAISLHAFDLARDAATSAGLSLTDVLIVVRQLLGLAHRRAVFASFSAESLDAYGRTAATAAAASLPSAELLPSGRAVLLGAEEALQADPSPGAAKALCSARAQQAVLEATAALQDKQALPAVVQLRLAVAEARATDCPSALINAAEVALGATPWDSVRLEAPELVEVIGTRGIGGGAHNLVWTAAEDEQLRSLREAGASFAAIATEMNHTQCSCINRYNNYLRPAVASFKTGGWTEEEDAIIIAKVNELGTGKWKKIMTFLPCRSNKGIADRHAQLMRKAISCLNRKQTGRRLPPNSAAKRKAGTSAGSGGKKGRASE